MLLLMFAAVFRARVRGALLQDTEENDDQDS